jgi:hypothetical protein
MTQVIIYNQDNGVPALVVPTQEALEKYGILAIAVKDVPAGKRFGIFDASMLPQDAPQEAWVVNDADLTDGVGGESNEFPAGETP